MSLAEKTNTSDTSKKPRLYSRGNDQINLDDYIRNLESGFDAWLNSRKIKDKYKDSVREAYREMVTRLNSGDGSFTSRLGGGFQDSTGKIKNADKGFDAAGVAASYLGHTLRDMDIYKEPEPTPDPSKIKLEDGALGTALTRRLLGSAGTIQDFIDRDPYNKDTRTRGNSVRSKDFRELLSTTAADLRAGVGEFSDWTEDLRTKGASDLEGLFTIFDNDGQITDDEYLLLARVTGMSDLRKMFSTGELTAPTVVASDGTKLRSGRTYSDKIRAIQNKWKPYTGLLVDPITIGNTSSFLNLGDWTKLKVGNAFAKATAKDLTTLIQDLINNKDYRLSAFIKSLKFPSNMPYPLGSDYDAARSLLLENALQKLKNVTANHNEGLHNFGENNLGTYYISGTDTNRNTGFVWDSNNNTISEMSIHNIPYWQAYINNWWDSLDSSDETDLDPTLTSVYSRKEGGILFALAGTIMDRHKGRGPGITGTNAWLSVPNTAANAYNIGTWDNYYNNAGIDNDINTAKFLDYGYLIDDKGHPLKDSNGNDLHGISAGLLGIYLNQLNQLGSGLSWNKIVNDKGYEAWNRKFDQTGLNMYFGGDSKKFGFMGPSTWNRHALLQRMLNTYNKDNPLKIGDDKIYWDGNRWIMPLPEIKPPTLGIEVTPPDPSAAKIFLTQPDNSIVNEDDPGALTQSSDRGSNFLNIAADWTPDLLGAGRLFASLRANNRITNILRPSLNPVLKDTYERYSPVTGAFSQMQLRNRQGAETLSQSHRPFTSDASLVAARMLEGQRHANDLLTQGFLADDQEIKRTQEQALARQEDNMARRSDVANFNRASINQTNRERAQLEATRVNKNWRSWDNFLGGIESRIRARNEEDRYDKLAYQKLLDELANSLVYLDELNQISDLVSKYQSANPGKSISSTSWWTPVSLRQTELIRRLLNDNIISAGKRRGYVYTDMYKDNPYVAKDWSKIIV